jgi:hypothetical protein
VLAWYITLAKVHTHVEPVTHVLIVQAAELFVFLVVQYSVWEVTQTPVNSATRVLGKLSCMLMDQVGEQMFLRARSVTASVAGDHSIQPKDRTSTAS